MGGLASAAADYTLSSGTYNSTNDYWTLTIPAGSSFLDVAVNVLDDDVDEFDETAILTLLDRVPDAA